MSDSTTFRYQGQARLKKTRWTAFEIARDKLAGLVLTVGPALMILASVFAAGLQISVHARSAIMFLFLERRALRAKSSTSTSRCSALRKSKCIALTREAHVLGGERWFRSTTTQSNPPGASNGTCVLAATLHGSPYIARTHRPDPGPRNAASCFRVQKMRPCVRKCVCTCRTQVQGKAPPPGIEPGSSA